MGGDSREARGAPRARELAAATPATRNRYADLLRAVSIVVVVLGHWLMAVLGWSDGKFTGRNILEVQPKLQVLTWVFQVMPIFFMVGGFTNAASWESSTRRGLTYAGWLRARGARLLRPAILFVAFWTALPEIAVAIGLPSGVARTGGREVALPLWFLAVYLVAVAAAPPLLALHRRHGIRLLVVLAAAAALVDLARFAFGVQLIGTLNFGFVWLAVLELGFLWRDGALTASRKTPWAMAAGGVVMMTALVKLGGYPVSMLDLTHSVRSNAFPPSFALLALGLWQAGAVLIFQDAANRALKRGRLWLTVVKANSMIMTFYLWNMSAVVLAAVVLLPTGIFPQPEPLSMEWSLLRPVWILACVVCLIPFLLGFRWGEGPIESPSLSSRGVLAAIVAISGTVAAAAGLAISAAQAFPVQGQQPLVPAIGIGLLVLGAALLKVDPLARRARLGSATLTPSGGRA